MTASNPSLDDWKRLYDLAAKVKELAPWKWMQETDVFGVQEPGSGDFGYVSVMGALGEHLSVAVYLGRRGLEGFWDMQELGNRLTPEVALQVPQLQASFEDREMISAEDRKLMKELGLKYRGAQAWPQFRSYRPGCFPWYLEKAEAEMLACALEQLLEVAPRFKENPAIFSPTKSDEDYLTRVKNNDQWEDVTLRVEFEQEKSFDLMMNEEALEALKRAMPGKMVVEADLSIMLNNPAQDNRKERPYFPYMLMLAEHESGYILASELLKPLPSIESMLGEIPAIVTEILANGLPPKEIQVKDPMLYLLLQAVAKVAGFRVTQTSHLRAIERAKREMKRFFGR
ncbi:MAG: hypothetical protein AB1750_13060 [Chloroflexota bacterium]